MELERRGKDVDALFARLGLSASAYREFPTRADGEDRASSAAQPERTAGSYEAEAGILPSTDVRSLATGDVEGLLAGAADTAPGKNSRGLKVALFSLSGGVGKTMLATSLARMLGGRSLQVALVNCSQSFALSQYLPAGAPRFGAVSFFRSPDGAPGVPVAVVDASTASFRGGKDETQTTMLIEELVLHADVVFFDMPSVINEASHRILLSCDHVIVPLAPDLRSESSIPAINDLLQVKQGSGPELHYILNRYDWSNPFHRTVRARMETSLGQQLYGVVVGEERLLEEATERGQTVSDYAPGAAMVEEVGSVADWLQSLSSRRSDVLVEIAAGGLA